MWQRCLSLDMDTIPSVLAHGTPGSQRQLYASKQLATRDGDLSTFQNQGSNQHMPVDVAFLFSLKRSPPLIMLYCSTYKLVGDFSCLPCSS